jgi:hypothetical protein
LISWKFSVLIIEYPGNFDISLQIFPFLKRNTKYTCVIAGTFIFTEIAKISLNSWFYLKLQIWYFGSVKHY